MKTILHITDHLSIGGTEILLKNTLPLLPDYNHVVCYLNGENEVIKGLENIPVYCLQHNKKKDILRTVSRLRKIIKKHHVNIIHAHLLWSSFIARLAKPKGVRLITTIHSVLSKDAFEKNKLSLWMERFTCNKQDDIIGVSQYVLDDYISHVPFKGNTHTLYNFIPHSFFEKGRQRQPYNLTERPIKCIAIGNLKDVKNYDFILDAFCLLPAGKFELLIVGEGGDREKLEKKIADNKLPVKLLGKRNDIEALLEDNQLFIQASLHEGFGLAIAEAVAVGLLPVISDIPVHKEITDNKAVYFSIKDTRLLADALNELADNNINLARIVQLRSHIEKIASANNYSKQLRSIYK